MYLTYSEYKAFGGTLDETDFTRFNLMATNTVNRVTRNRIYKDYQLDIEVPYEDNLKALMCELVDSSKGYSATETVTSKSNQGMSKSYSVLSRNDVDKLQYELCSSYLYGCLDACGVPLMYSGVQMYE